MELIGIILLLYCFVDLLSVDFSSWMKFPYKLTKKYWAWLVWQMCLFLVASAAILTGLIPDIAKYMDSSFMGKAGIVIRLLLFIICMLLYVFLYQVSVKPDVLIRLFRGKRHRDAVSETAPECRTVQWEGQYYLTNDINFPSRYPNHFFDIYHTRQNFDGKKPVFIYAHGGGYIFGDKANGDPNALGIAGIIRMIKQLLDAGFIVISTNYVFAPEYGYPAPIQQMSELLDFLIKNKSKFGLDMERIVLGGGSAGGQIMAQLANIQTSMEYAREMKIRPVLTKGQIKAIYHGCALLDNERFGMTNSKLTNYVFYQMGRAYFKTGVLRGNEKVVQSDIIRHVTKAYPPSFICDGNAGTFNEQAHDLEKRLNDLGIRNKTLVYDTPGTKKIPHGFDTLEYEEGYASMREMVRFVWEEVSG